MASDTGDLQDLVQNNLAQNKVRALNDVCG